MGPDGVDRHIQLSRDLRALQAGGQVPQDAELALRQRVQQRLHVSGHRRPCPTRRDREDLGDQPSVGCVQLRVTVEQPRDRSDEEREQQPVRLGDLQRAFKRA